MYYLYLYGYHHNRVSSSVFGWILFTVDFFSLFILFLCSQRAVEHFSFEDIFVFVFNGKQRLMMVKKRLMWWFALKMSLRLSNASIWECFILDILVYLPFFRSCFQGMILNEMEKKRIYISKSCPNKHTLRDTYTTLIRILVITFGILQ